MNDKPLPTSADIVREVRRLAAERPDYVYEGGDDAGCRYDRAGGESGCIIGEALAALGLVQGELEALGYETVRAALDILAECGLVGHLDESSVGFLEHVQRAQDKRLPWDAAVRVGDRPGALDW